MKVLYTDHIKNRLGLRKIEYDLPKEIFEQAKERYLDKETGHSIAVMRAVFCGKIKEIMVAYVIEQADVKLLTIHPLKAGQKENRIESGRWRKI